MSLKQDFISYIETLISDNPLPDNLQEYWNKFKDDPSGKISKEGFTENGKLILQYLQDHQETSLWKSKEIAEGLFIATKTIAGAIRKLVNDGYVEKVGSDPNIYSITDKGKNIVLNKENNE